MKKSTLKQAYLTQLSRKTTFHDNGDVDFEHSVACVDENGDLVAAIIVGNVTDYPTLGSSLPNDVSDTYGSAQVLLLFIDNSSSYDELNELMRDFLERLLPSKIIWCWASEYTPEALLSRLGFKSHVNGLAKTFYTSLN